MLHFPITYQAIELPAYNQNTVRALLSLKITEKTLINLKPSQILVRMEAAPCNPSDLAFMQGGYNIRKPLPAVMGFEGTGTVVEVAENLNRNEWIGKRVSCFSQEDQDGTWAEYFLATPEQLMLIDPGLEVAQAACFFINPFTAKGLINHALQNKSKAVIVNAAGSRVAGFLLALAKKYEIKTIAIVRKDTTAQKLMLQGWDKVLISTDDNFQESLKVTASLFEANTAFDAVAGEMTGMLANAMPYGSEVVVYGGLSGSKVQGIDALKLIFNKLNIHGFDLNHWMKTHSKAQIEEVKNELSQLIIGNYMATEIITTVTMDEVIKGIRLYIGNMSAGKILITF